MVKLNLIPETIDKQPKQFLHSGNSTLQFGFTLIELMITVAIIGILAAIAYPSYTSFVTQSNRSEGQRELLRFANLQEQYFVDYRTYSPILRPLGETTLLGNEKQILTENGHYKIKIIEADASIFVLKANAQGSQKINDSVCSPLTINEAGEKGPPGCWD